MFLQAASFCTNGSLVADLKAMQRRQGFGQAVNCAKFCILFLWGRPGVDCREIPPAESFVMSLQKEDVEKIAHLARLAISDEDVAGYAHNLSNILNLVEQMSSVDTSGVTPMAHPLDACQRLRNDEVTETNQREHFQSIAPQVEAGLYLVPKVIE